MLNLPSKIVNRAIRRKEASALRPNVSSASVGNVSRHGRAPRGGKPPQKVESLKRISLAEKSARENYLQGNERSERNERVEATGVIRGKEL